MNTKHQTDLCFDAEKLRAYGQALRKLAVPTVTTLEGIEALELADSRIAEMCDDLERLSDDVAENTRRGL
jgi:hypothetical protein